MRLQISRGEELEAKKIIKESRRAVGYVFKTSAEAHTKHQQEVSGWRVAREEGHLDGRMAVGRTARQIQTERNADEEAPK